MTDFVVLPDPSPAALAAARQLVGDREAIWFAPWAMGGTAGPAPLRRFAARRRLEGATAVRGWPLFDGALAAWSRGGADRRYRALAWRRRAAAELAARRIRGRAGVHRVIAPSLAALEPMVAAPGGAERILLEDLPGLRQLHTDLALAASRHPGCAFLHRYRAPDDQIVRQEREAVLADRIAVRGSFAAARHRERAIARVEHRADPVARSRAPGPPRVVLAGLAAARHGSAELLEVLEELEGFELAVRAGEGAEPAALFRHPRVRAERCAPEITGAAAVLAPSWCECYPREVAIAAASGIPVIATARAAGFTRPGALVEPGDPGGIAAALAAALDDGARASRDT